jgi:hypothetical protein
MAGTTSDLQGSGTSGYQQLANDSPRATQLKQWAKEISASPAGEALQRYQQLANNSPLAMQLRQQATALQMQSPVMQMQWLALNATNFVAANPPLLKEQPAVWKARVAAALEATNYDQQDENDRRLLSDAFTAAYRANLFTQLTANNFVAAHVPVRPQTHELDLYKAANLAQLTAAGYLANVSDNFVTVAFEAYIAAHPFGPADAQAFFALHPPLIGPQDHDAYLIANIEALTDWGIFDGGMTYAAAGALFQVPIQQYRAAQDLSHAQLNQYYNDLPAALRQHVFDGEFNNGGPRGLHAYGGAAGNTVLQTIGATTGVHIAIWANAQGANAGRCKWSSMFPADYPVGMTAWHLLNDADNQQYPPVGRPVAGLPAWQAINIGQAGATRYPIYGAVNTTAAVQGLAGAGVITHAMQHGHPVYTWHGHNVQYIIDN